MTDESAFSTAENVLFYLFQFCQLFVHPCQLFNSVRYIMEEEIVSQNSHQHQDRYGQYHPPLMVIIKKYTEEYGNNWVSCNIAPMK